jgi:hypothetical protein
MARLALELGDLACPSFPVSSLVSSRREKSRKNLSEHPLRYHAFSHDILPVFEDNWRIINHFFLSSVLVAKPAQPTKPPPSHRAGGARLALDARDG